MTNFGMPSDLTPDQHYAVAVKAARQTLADHEAGGEIPAKQLRAARQVIAAWGEPEDRGDADESSPGAC